MKFARIDKLVLRGFIGPYVMSFLVAEFVLVMQFLWKEIEDISGKGVGILDILELMFYFSISLIPQAIPIAILLSSVFVFGNLSEKFELTSFKSAGVSLLRIMRTGIFLGVATMLFSLLASNYLVPKSNFVFFKRFYTIKKQKPTLSIEAGMFNDDFNGYSIYAKSKDKEDQSLRGVILYDQVSEGSRYSMTNAEEGNMQVTEDGRFLEMKLYNGAQYREIEETKEARKDPTLSKHPFMRTKFEKWQKFFDMAEFELDSNSVNVERKKYDMLNAFQLQAEIDSINSQIKVKRDKAFYLFNDVLLKDTTGFSSKEKKTETTKPKSSKLQEIVRKKNIISSSTKNTKSKTDAKKKKVRKPKLNKIFNKDYKEDTSLVFTSIFDNKQMSGLLKSASTKARRHADQTKISTDKIRNMNHNKDLFKLKMHSKFSWALICLIFLFIGAPFGSIIRKGGYGYPLLMSIVFFMIFILLSIMGEKLCRGGQMGPVLAAWLPCIALFPFAVFFTVKALNDSSLKEFDWITKLKNRWFESGDSSLNSFI